MRNLYFAGSASTAGVTRFAFTNSTSLAKFFDFEKQATLALSAFWYNEFFAPITVWDQNVDRDLYLSNFRVDQRDGHYFVCCETD